MRYAYPALVETDEAGFVLVTFPDVPEAGADGESLDEALAEAADALGAALAGYVHADRDLPEPSAPERGQYMVPVRPHVAAALALRAAMRAQGITNVELARRLGVDERVARRLVNPDYPSKLEKMAAALEAVGRDLVVEDQEHALEPSRDENR